MAPIKSIYFLYVSLGAVIGACSRYGISLVYANHWSQHNFPLATLTVNILGSFMMGLFTAPWNRDWISDVHTRHLLMTGFCGSFTTFSSFSMESYHLFKQGHSFLALSSISANLFGSLLGFLLGYWLGQKAAHLT